MNFWKSYKFFAVVVFSTTLMGCSQNTVKKDSKIDVVQLVERENSASLSGDYAQMRAQQVTEVIYDLSLVIDEHRDVYDGSVAINFTLNNDNNAPVILDFEQGDILSVTINGQAREINYQKWFISLAPELFQPGKNRVVINYSRPYGIDGDGFHRFVDPIDGEVYLYTNFEPYSANLLFPHFDQPDIKAVYRLDVIAPEQWQVISSTRENNIKNLDGKKQWFFPESKKISSYVFSVHAGNYVKWQDNYEDKYGAIPLRLFARQSVADYVKTEVWFKYTKQSFQFFNEYFELPYPFIKYDQVIVPDFNAGAMENIAAVTFNESFIQRGEKSIAAKISLANTIAHEMAHMWFGDLVTMRWWNGLWLNESFATYMAHLALVENSDFDNVWDVFYSGTKQWAYRSDDSVNTHAIELPVASTADALSNFDGITYGKGASVLKQIPHYIGPDNFRRGVSHYLKKFSYKNTELSDFMGELGSAAGKDLTQWTQDWLYNAGLNTLEAQYQCQAGKITHFTLLQTAPEALPRLREQRVQVGLYYYQNNSLALQHKFAVTYKGEKTPLNEAVGQKCPDLVYPNEEDWGYVKVNLDDRSVQAIQAHINKITNVSTRLMLWQSLADSVRDAKLSPTVFVDLVLANIETEQDYTIIRKIGRSLLTALYYLDRATEQKMIDFKAKYSEVEEVYFQKLLAATPGSDHQKLWFQGFTSLATTEQSLARLEQMLAGSLTFDKLTIDQDKRWKIIGQLSRYQFGNYQQLLAQEKQRDNTDRGIKKAIYSEVVQPEAHIKAKWLTTFLENPDKLKISSLRYIVRGLFPSEQVSLAKPFKTQLLNYVDKMNQQENLNLLDLAVDLIPASCTLASEQELAQLVVDYQAMKPQAIKGIKAKHESVARCVKVLGVIKSSSNS